MTDFEFYSILIKEGCNGCPAYNALGHCGTWTKCDIPELHQFLDEMCWSEDYFLDYIYFQDYILPTIYEDEDEFDEFMSNGGLAQWQSSRLLIYWSWVRIPHPPH